MPTPIRRTRSPGAPPAAAPVEGQRIVRAAAARTRAASVEAHGKLTVAVEAPNQEVERREVFVPAGRFAPDERPAELKIGMGKTVSLGHGSYEFLRFDVSLSMPTLPENLDETRDFISNYVASTLIEEEQSWLGSPNVSPQQAKRRG